MSKLNSIGEMLEVLESMKAGKKIEYLSGGWNHTNSINPDFSGYKYRVKPEPLVMYVNVYSAERYLYDSKEAAESGAVSGIIKTAVKMVEVVQ